MKIFKILRVQSNSLNIGLLKSELFMNWTFTVDTRFVIDEIIIDAPLYFIYPHNILVTCIL